MTDDPTKYHRRSIRLNGYDYSQTGAYFITVCTQGRECLFGGVVDGEIRLNEYGKIAVNSWKDIPAHFRNAKLDAFLVMPNHIHGIIMIVGARHAVPLHQEQFGKPIPCSISTIIRSFKSAVTKRINELRQTSGIGFWQRNYYEHIIRVDDELNNIREYITNNPLRWHEDEENPINPLRINKP
jgi:putative transposase